MPSRETEIHTLLLHYFDGNERVVDYRMRSKSIIFAQEFFYAQEKPEMVIEATTAGEYEDSVGGYLWCTNHRLFFAGAKGTIFKKPIYEDFGFFGNSRGVGHI